MLVLNGRQRYPLVVEPLEPEEETQTVNGVLEVAFGWRIVLILKQIEIVLYLLIFQLRGQAAKMKRHLADIPDVIVEGAFAPAGSFHPPFKPAVHVGKNPVH